MTDPTAPAVVITDLDGTLLDHHSYDWTPARPALDALRQRRIPVVFNTSKTLEESRRLQQETGISGPVIVENGSCIATDKGEIALGRKRDSILQWLQQSGCDTRYRYQGFTQMGVDGIVAATGLDPERAAQADGRQWSEPLLWQDSDEALSRFAAEAGLAGLHLLRGGRFVHLLGDCDKGRAAQALLNTFRQERRPLMVALGDSQNDLAMLQVADRAFWVRSPVKGPPCSSSPSFAPKLTRLFGPAGWNEAIQSLVKEGVFDE